MLIHLVAAARPNFMKIAPLYHALKKEDWATPVIVHTGQHYDLNMSDAFFQDLGLQEPDIHLGLGSGTHAEQTGRVMIAYEKLLMEKRPDLVIVVGDVNPTVASALAASKIQYTQSFPNCNKKNKSSSYELSAGSNERGHRPLLAHLEAGLRSFDRSMPEEINRLVTDALADILWTPSPDADENLANEGIPKEKINRVGNVMLDSLEMLRDKIETLAVYKEFDLNRGDYGVVTLLRPSNVDHHESLELICRGLCRISRKVPLVFPVHPRTRKNLEQDGLMSFLKEAKGLVLLQPLNYIRFMSLVFHCWFAITDSGGIQEETTYLGIPCLTMRPNTERPITVEQGTNQMYTPDNLERRIDKIVLGEVKESNVPEFWHGQTAGRVVKSIQRFLSRGLS